MRESQEKKRQPHKGKPHSAQTKAAVIAALLAGEQVNEVARRFSLAHAVVSRIKSGLPAEKLDEVGLEKRERLFDLIEGFLRRSLHGAMNIADQTEDAEWMAEQSADQLGLLYGQFSQESARILELAGRIFSERERQDAA